MSIKSNKPARKEKAGTSAEIPVMTKNDDEIRLGEAKILSEEEIIIKQAKTNGTYMKAPNGKPTNLDERQWVQVRTKAFKKWFGDWETSPEEASKVVDENGEPKVVLHGTPHKFNTFDKGKQGSSNDYGWLGTGFYFYGNNPRYAELYAKGGDVKEVFLNVRSPYYATSSEMEMLAETNNRETSESFTEDVLSENCDGMSYDGDLNDEWVVYDPNQIKSATENIGEFSLYNDDIRFRVVHHGTGSLFDKFSTEKIGTGEGNAAFGWGLYFTDKKEIAEYYAETIGDMPTYVLYKNDKPADMREELSRIIYNYDGDVKKAIRGIQKNAKMWKEEGDLKYAAELMKNVKRLQQEDPKAWVLKKERNRYIYDVDIPDSGYLNWDKAVPQEHKSRIQNQAEVENIAFYWEGDKISPEEYFTKVGKDLKGEQLYKCLTNTLGSDMNVSLFLNRSGFNGIEYEAGRTFANKKGNERNYVVFDDKAVRIIHHLRYRSREGASSGLLNAGIPDLPIELREDKLTLKTSEEYACNTMAESQRMEEDIAKKKLECAINDLSKILNTPVKIIHDLHDITDADKKIQTDKRSAKGWFNPNTDEVVIVLANIVSMQDMQATLLHEIVAHKGLQGLLGDKLGNMMDIICRNLPSDVKKEVLDSATKNYRGNTRLATEEYLATVAEKGVTNPGLWINVQASIKQFFRSLGIDLMVTEKDIMFLLWKSKKHLEKQSMIFSVKEERKSNIFDTIQTAPTSFLGGSPSRVRSNSISVENGNDAREINNSRMEQEFQKVDVSKINWKQLNAKFGISKEMLEEKGVLEDMLNRKKSNRLLNVKYETVSGQKEFEARVAFREKEGGITLQFYPVRQTPPLDQPYHGYTFTEEDKRALLQTGHLGKVIEIQPYNKGKEQVYISLDPLTNDIVHLRKDRIKLKNEVGHAPLTDQQKSELLEGRPVYIKEMTNREGKKFSAFVQIDADKKALAFLPTSRVLIEHISEINGVPLNEEQKRMLKEGGTVSLSGLQSRDGRSFSAKVSYDPEERKFKMDFPEVNKMDFTEEQKTALAAGEKVLLTGLISKNGKPYDMIVYQDKETGKIEKEWPVKETAFKVKLSEEQKKELQNGRYVWIEGLQKKDGTTFKAPVKWNAKEGFFEFAQVAKKEQQTEKDKSQAANQAREETPRRGQRL